MFGRCHGLRGLKALWCRLCRLREGGFLDEAVRDCWRSLMVGMVLSQRGEWICKKSGSRDLELCYCQRSIRCLSLSLCKRDWKGN